MSLMCGSASGSGPDAASLALGGGGLAASRGISSAWQNPAHLALPDGPSWSIGLVGAQAAIGNDAFSLSDYQSYNGAYLDQGAKDEILGAIGPEGMALHAAASGALPGIHIGPFAAFSTTMLHSSATLSRTWAELVLDGVQLDEAIDLGTTAGVLDAWSELGVAHGRRIGPLAFGASIKWLQGHYHVESEAAGDLSPTVEDGVITSLGATGSLRATTAEGGSGWGVDVGLALLLGRTTLSAAASNFAGSIHWDQNPRLTGLVYDEELELGEEPPEPQEIDETIDPFDAALPQVWRAGLAHPVSDRLLAVAAASRVGSGADAVDDFGAGLELRPFSWFGLRFGSGHSSVDGVRFTGGIGFSPGPIALDFGVGHRGGFFGSAMGLDLALTLALVP